MRSKVYGLISLYLTYLGEDMGGETRTPRKGETRFSPLLDVFDL